MSFRKAIEIMHAYPAKQLIAGRYKCQDGLCALAVLIPKTQEITDSLPDGIERLIDNNVEIRMELDSLGMTRDEAMDLQAFNDVFSEREGFRARYDAVLEWMQARLRSELHRSGEL